MEEISNIILPMMVCCIVICGIKNKCNVYSDFLKGAKKGLDIVINIFPTLVGVMLAVGILRASGGLEFIEKMISPISKIVKVPSCIFSLGMLKMFSSSAATGILFDIYKEYGVDSFAGLTASIMLSCTETIFYTLSLYFCSIKITNIRWTLKGAIVSSVVGIIVSIYLAGIIC